MKTACGARARSGGFTLIELIIVAVIVGILAAVAIPSYRTHILKANRAAAESFIMNVANKQEQYMLDARSYATTLAALGMTTPTEVAQNYGNPVITVSAGPPPGYTIRATPQGAQAGDPCGYVQIDQTGAKTAAGGTASCW